MQARYGDHTSFHFSFIAVSRPFFLDAFYSLFLYSLFRIRTVGAYFYIWIHIKIYVYIYISIYISIYNDPYQRAYLSEYVRMYTYIHLKERSLVYIVSAMIIHGTLKRPFAILKTSTVRKRRPERSRIIFPRYALIYKNNNVVNKSRARVFARNGVKAVFR